MLGAVWLAVWVLPNTQEWLARYKPALDYDRPNLPAHLQPPPAFARFEWKPSPAWAAVALLLGVFTITQMSRVSEFIYWQF